MTTHTCAELEVSAETYNEIAQKLRENGYDPFITKGDFGLPMPEPFTIDMQGIGLVRGPSRNAEFDKLAGKPDPTLTAEVNRIATERLDATRKAVDGEPNVNVGLMEENGDDVLVTIKDVSPLISYDRSRRFVQLGLALTKVRELHEQLGAFLGSGIDRAVEATCDEFDLAAKDKCVVGSVADIVEGLESAEKSAHKRDLVTVEPGTTPWAMEMLRRGKKIRNKNWEDQNKPSAQQRVWYWDFDFNALMWHCPTEGGGHVGNMDRLHAVMDVGLLEGNTLVPMKE